jgi:hypothetical protein
MMKMNRIRAGLTHLAISAAIATLVFLAIYLVWFPDVLFQGAGGRDLFMLIACVDVTLGPLITFIVFVPGKKGLKFDLVVIGTLQIAALAYGVWVLFEARPVYIVFVQDRFELVRANDISEESLKKGRAKGMGDLPVTGPQTFGSRLPKDPDEVMRLGMSAAAGGADVQGNPEYYIPFDQVRDEVRARGKPITRLRDFNREEPGEVDRVVASTGRKEDELLYLPMRAGKRDLTVLVDAKTGSVVRIALLRPWQY